MKSSIFKKGKIRKLQMLNRKQASTITELDEKLDAEYVRGVLDGMKANNTSERYSGSPDDPNKILLHGFKLHGAYTVPFNEKYIKVTMHKGYLRWTFTGGDLREDVEGKDDTENKMDHK